MLESRLACSGRAATDAENVFGNADVANVDSEAMTDEGG